ncbi:MAG: thioredoxin domain-containing protein [Gammaproteobacteria bacterium]|nr:thioredoxin domain-containing protein [Gammaproteobacteria bacterium]
MTNELIRETSPYLLQHAENPVDWKPWSADALELARTEDKPILLSIGYSACHWCHVMAHESFEDADTAALMNRLYVNVKVDREERPDIDKIYQTAHQLYTGRAGGWPLTAFLTPDDHVPIVVGTYFPKEARYGMPSFRDVLAQVEAYYRQYRGEVRTRGNALLEALRRMEAARDAPTDALSAAPLEQARQRLLETFDREHGGFGGAPKFPRAACLELLLEQSRSAALGDDAAGQTRRAVTHTLNRMALGGLHDHLGGGFFRYSVDREWSIPHFEKMLYDNAELLALYSDAYAATGEALYADVAADTAEWVCREMQDELGGYHAALDADSEGEEGKYYVFTPEDFDAALTPAEAELAKRVYGLDGEPNFADPHTGRKAWHLRVVTPPEAAAEDAADVAARLDDARRRLFEARSRRVPPGRDDKVLVSWNGLMIRGMARAARHLGRDDLADSATRAVDFIRERMWKHGRLHATYRDGRARFAAYLDDHAFLADGLLELLEYRWRTEDLKFAMQLADVVLARFADEAGGFFFTADDHESLIHRPKPFADESVPSGNGVMIRVLLALGHLLGEQRYLDAAEKALKAAMPTAAQYPDAHAAVLLALARYVEPPEFVIVRADPDALGSWQRLLDSGYAPHRASFSIPSGVDAALPGLLGERASRGDGPVAYVCRGTQCLAPIEDLDALRAALGGARRGSKRAAGSGRQSARRRTEAGT